MSRIIHNIEVGLDEDLAEVLTRLAPGFQNYRVLKKSVDARRRHHPHFVYSVEIALPGESLVKPEFRMEKLKHTPHEVPLIIGAGPAGLFAALRLVERGIKCRLIERGSTADVRIKGINRFWRYGELNPDDNVCFGEGGAGLYSDGKLITRIKSPHIAYVMNRLVQFGAPAEIEYTANPHVGSDKIRRVIPKLRQFLIDHGCEIHFNSAFSELIMRNQQVIGVRTRQGQNFESSHVILATGHSAQDIFSYIQSANIFYEAKAFAIGLRIEHPQKMINQIQYRQSSEHPALGAANYKLVNHDPQSQIGVYSFCMCPGGYVLSSGTEADGIVCNGMSNFNRNSPFANSALVVTTDFAKLAQTQANIGLLERRKIEQQAFRAVQEAGGTKQLPAQNLNDFLAGQISPVRTGNSPSGSVPVGLHQILPEWMCQKIRSSLLDFENKMKGFLSPEAVLYGVETRTSSPIRITRDEVSLQSLSHQGLYPCGEGAGYAGGITSAAVDGIRVAEAIISHLSSSSQKISKD